MNTLIQDVLVNISNHLNLQELLKLRCVSKTWLKAVNTNYIYKQVSTYVKLYSRMIRMIYKGKLVYKFIIGGRCVAPYTYPRLDTGDIFHVKFYYDNDNISMQECSFPLLDQYINKTEFVCNIIKGDYVDAYKHWHNTLVDEEWEDDEYNPGYYKKVCICDMSYR